MKLEDFRYFWITFFLANTVFVGSFKTEILVIVELFASYIFLIV